MKINKIAAIRLSELVSRLGGELRGNDLEVCRVAPLDRADAKALGFLSNPKLKQQLRETAAAAVIVRPNDADGLTIPCIVTKDPYLYFAKVAQIFHPLPLAEAGIHSSAVVAADAVIDPTAEIGPLVVIGHGAHIGAGAIVQSGSCVGENVSIGVNSILYPRVTVYQDCMIGDHVIIHSGTVIGSDGFGNAWAGDHWEKIPQTGRVLIGNDVEIGANTTIDRGALGDTVVANGARIDNLIQVGHNVEIGACTAIAACTGISGSAKIGAGCLIGGGVGITGHLSIADRVTLLGGTTVLSNIDESGVYGGPTPALPHGAWRRNAAHNRNLDQLVKRVRQLEKQLRTEGAESEDLNKENA